MQNSLVKIQLNDGQTIPSIGLGTSQVEHVNQIEEMIERALEAGYRHFDTAFFYKNERFIGNVFKKWFESGKLQRQDLYIVSKLPQIGMWPYRVNEFLKMSLSDLGIDYVDLYLIQFPVGFQYFDASELIPLNEAGNVVLDTKIHLEAIWKAMEHEVRRGRTKSIGICNFNQSQLARILYTCHIPPVVIQVEVNLYSQQKSLKKFCDDNNIRVCAFSPLGSAESRLTNHFEINRLSQKYEKSAAQIVLRFLVQAGFIVVQKSTNTERLQENIEIFNFDLNNEDMEILQNLDRGVSGIYKREFFDSIYPGAQLHPEYPWR